MTLRQHVARQKLKAIENELNPPPHYDKIWHAYLLKIRHEAIVELNRIQNEEWNYD